MTNISDGDLVRITKDVPNDAEITAGDIGSVARVEVEGGTASYVVYVEGKGEVGVGEDEIEAVG
jgi:hypothetical protein